MHALIVGISYTGKSMLAKRIAAGLAAHNNIIVYDPLQSANWPESALLFSSPEKFLAHVEQAQNAYVFVDEAKTLWDHDEKRADALLYKRRHQGLLVFLIAQRATMIKPNARNQCSRLYAFKQTSDDARALAGDYDDSIRDMITRLPPCEFIATNGHTVERFKLDFSNGIPPTYTPAQA